MNYCNQCNVNVYEHHSSCPLCNKSFENHSNSIYSYMEYEKIQSTVFSKLQRIAKLFLLLLPIISITINILTFRINPYYWSPILIFGYFYAFHNIFYTFNKNIIVGRRIVTNYAFLIIWCIVIDVSIGYKAWSLTFLFPLFGIGTSVLLLLNLAIKKNLQESISYIFIMIALNFSSILISLALDINIIWPSIASFIFSIIMIVIMVFYSKYQIQLELEKRMIF